MIWPIKRIHIETSTVCNADCLICPQALIRRQRRIDLERIKKLITDDSRAYAIDLFEFHNYNEPLLYFDEFCELTELVNLTHSTERVGLVSNASVMSADKIDRLLTLRLKHVLFSLDGFSKAVYEDHRKGLDRDEVYGNVETFIDKSAVVGGPVPMLVFTVTSKNAHEVGVARAHFRDRRCRFYVHGCDGRGVEVGKEPALRDVYSTVPCDYALDGVYILSNLDVVTCCEDWSGKEIMGNLGRQTLQEVVDGPEYERFRALHFSDRKRESVLCKDCKTNMTYADSFRKEIGA